MEMASQAPDVLDKLRDSGYQLTPQRRYVIERCLQMDGHFTADDLQDVDTDDSDQEFSRATVYNTLNVLVEVGFLRELGDMAESSYYEVTGQLHPHAHCKSCGALIDVPVNLEQEVENWELPFQVDDVKMTLEGFCEHCSE
jgi:Fe2+ or Zn2+ uptake regulation protein